MHVVSGIPLTRLFLHEKRSVAIAANGCIYVTNSRTGDVTHATADHGQQADKTQDAVPIVAASIDESMDYLVTASPDKIIRVWDLNALHVVSKREVPKKPTEVRFTRNTEAIVVSDKFGDVHSYPRLEEKAGNISSGELVDKRKDSQRLHDGSLLLGHVSLLTTFMLSPDEKYIITADRDEHIRISWFPQAFTIERFCLGHEKFVSALHIPSWDHSLLVSGGGDPTLKIWKWMEGRILHEITIADVAMPFIKVARRKSGRGGDGSDGEDNEATKKLSSRQRRRQRKNIKKDGDEGINEERDEVATVNTPSREAMDGDSQEGASNTAEMGATQTQAADKDASEAKPLLAVQKIESIEEGSSKLLVFSLYGANALFYCQIADLMSTEKPEVHAIDVQQPVLDFSIYPRTNEVWVSIDGNWSDGQPIHADGLKFVKLIKIVGAELQLAGVSSRAALFDSLNNVCVTNKDSEPLEDVDLYSALSILPKNIDVEHNAMDDNLKLLESARSQLSGKELGRLKSKKAATSLEAKRKVIDATLLPDDGSESKKKKGGLDAVSV